MIKHLDIKIFGDVFDVGFRYFAKAKAEELNLFGFVKNDPGDFVYIEVEGEQEKLDKFIEWCKTGPRYAKVSNVETQEKSIQNFNSFNIN